MGENRSSMEQRFLREIPKEEDQVEKWAVKIRLWNRRDSGWDSGGIVAGMVRVGEEVLGNGIGWC